jgi:hypothetical protein
MIESSIFPIEMARDVGLPTDKVNAWDYSRPSRARLGISRASILADMAGEFLNGSMTSKNGQKTQRSANLMRK